MLDAIPHTGGSVAEVLVPFPEPLEPSTQVRSTLICASIQSLRQRGLYDAYLEGLTAPQREEVQALTAGLWLPIDRALVHYGACDRLPLERSQRIEIGGDVANRIQQSLVSVIVRLTREGGMSPWSVLGSAEKLRARTWRGGGIRVKKLGPKDAQLEWAEMPCARSPHFRYGFTGILRSLCDLYARRTFVSEDSQSNDSTIVVRVSWA